MRIQDRLDQITKLLHFDPILEDGKDACHAWDYIAQQIIPRNGIIKSSREVFAEECLRTAYEPDIQTNSKMLAIFLCRLATRCMGVDWVNCWLNTNYYDLVNPKTKKILLRKLQENKYFK